MKKFILIAVMSLSLLPVSSNLMAQEQEEKVYTVSGPCGYFSGTAEECAEFMDMCDDGRI